MLGSILHRFQSVVEHGRHRIGKVISRLTKPISSSPALGTLTELHVVNRSWLRKTYSCASTASCCNGAPNDPG